MPKPDVSPDDGLPARWRTERDCPAWHALIRIDGLPRVKLPAKLAISVPRFVCVHTSGDGRCADCSTVWQRRHANIDRDRKAPASWWWDEQQRGVWDDNSDFAWEFLKSRDKVKSRRPAHWCCGRPMRVSVSEIPRRKRRKGLPWRVWCVRCGRGYECWHGTRAATTEPRASSYPLTRVDFNTRIRPKYIDGWTERHVVDRRLGDLKDKLDTKWAKGEEFLHRTTFMNCWYVRFAQIAFGGIYRRNTPRHPNRKGKAYGFWQTVGRHYAARSFDRYAVYSVAFAGLLTPKASCLLLARNTFRCGHKGGRKADFRQHCIAGAKRALFDSWRAFHTYKLCPQCRREDTRCSSCRELPQRCATCRRQANARRRVYRYRWQFIGNWEEISPGMQRSGKGVPPACCLAWWARFVSRSLSCGWLGPHRAQKPPSGKNLDDDDDYEVVQAHSERSGDELGPEDVPLPDSPTLDDAKAVKDEVCTPPETDEEKIRPEDGTSWDDGGGEWRVVITNGLPLLSAQERKVFEAIRLRGQTAARAASDLGYRNTRMVDRYLKRADTKLRPYLKIFF